MNEPWSAALSLARHGGRCDGTYEPRAKSVRPPAVPMASGLARDPGRTRPPGRWSHERMSLRRARASGPSAGNVRAQTHGAASARYSERQRAAFSPPTPAASPAWSHASSSPMRSMRRPRPLAMGDRGRFKRRSRPANRARTPRGRPDDPRRPRRVGARLRRSTGRHHRHDRRALQRRGRRHPRCTP
jgi:hypothetical protein